MSSSDDDSLFSDIYYSSEVNVTTIANDETQGYFEVDDNEEVDQSSDDDLENLDILSLPVYTFIRSISTDIHISPFDIDIFLNAFDFFEINITDQYAKNSSCNLMNEIHYRLMCCCLSILEIRKMQYWWMVPWMFLDLTTWPEFLLPFFELWMLSDDDVVARSSMKLAMLLRALENSNIIYMQYPRKVKILILQGFINILISNELVAFVLEERERVRNRNDDPFPLFKKGSDGYPDVCVLCSEGGDLLCCEYCPGSYHRQCLYEKNSSSFEGEWQCYECLVPDPMHGRSRLVWHPCRGGFLSFVGSMIVYKRFGKSAISDYSEISCRRLRRLAYTSTYNSLNYQLFRIYLGRLVKEGRYILEDQVDDSFIDADIVDENGVNIQVTDEYHETYSNDIESVATDSDFEYTERQSGNYFDDESLNSYVSDDQNRKRRRLADKFLSKNTKEEDLDNVRAPSMKYMRLDEMQSSTKIFQLTDIDISRLAINTLYPRQKLLDGYINHYKDAKSSRLFPDMRSQFIPSRMDSRHIKSALEALYHALGAAVSVSIINFPLSKDDWLVRLLQADSIIDCRRLLFELANSADPRSFRLRWFTSAIESEDDCLGRLKPIRLPSDDKRKRHQKTIPFMIRFHRFVSLKEKCTEQEKSVRRKSMSHQKRVPTHLLSPSSQRNNDSMDEDVNDEEDVDNRSNSKPNDVDTNGETQSVDEEIIHINQQRGTEFTVFQTGRRLLPHRERCSVPSKYLRRLGRCGGLGFLPLVGYNFEPNQFGSVPFYWYWNYRVKHCMSYEALILLIRYLEESFVDRIQTRIVSKYYHDNDSGKNSDMFIDEDMKGFILKERLRKSIPCNRETKYYQLIYNHPSYKGDISDLYRQDFNTPILMEIFNQFIEQKCPLLQYELISSDQSVHGRIKSHHETDLCLLSSYRLRNWVTKILELNEAMEITTECRRLKRFCETVYDIIMQSGYSEEDEMMIHKEVQIAIQKERELTRNDLAAIMMTTGCLYEIIPSIVTQPKRLAILIDHFLNKAVIAVSEVVKYDLVHQAVESKSSESIRMTTRRTSLSSVQETKPEGSQSDVQTTPLTDEEKYTIRTESVEGPKKIVYDMFKDPMIFKHKKKSPGTMEVTYTKQRVLSRKESAYVDRSYCATLSPTKNQWYLPQVGDEVIYYVTGHREYVNYYSDGNKIDRKGLLKKSLDNENGVACRILTIDYEFPMAPMSSDPGIQLVIQLGVCSSQSIPQTKSFVIVYRPGHTSAEFLVLRETIEKAYDMQWKPEMKFSMVYEGGQRYEGTITQIERDNRGLCSWAGAKVQWDSWGEDRINEWELELPPIIIPNEEKTLKGRRSVSKKVNITTAEPEPTPSELQLIARRDYINKKLAAITDKLMKISEFEAFRGFVDGNHLISVKNCQLMTGSLVDDTAPDYSCYIPICIYLDLMKARSENRYYRQPHGYLGDARSLFVNCVCYNMEQSPLSLAAANLYRSILRELILQFPHSPFHDYILFDKCLGNKVSIASMLQGGVNILETS